MSDISGIASATAAPAQDPLREQVLNQSYQVLQGLKQKLPETAQEAPPAENPLTEEEKQALEASILELDQLVKPLSIGLNVQRVDSLNRFYVELFNRETGETIREIPSRKIIEMQENLRAMQGLLFDERI